MPINAAPPGTVKESEVSAMVTGAMTAARAGALVLCVMTLVPAGSAVPSAQQRSGDDWCRDNSDSERERFCEVRTFTVPAGTGTLAIGNTNGGINIEGQSRGDVAVEARVTASARAAGRAREIARAVTIEATVNRIEADGPRNGDGEGWSVDYRLAMPRSLNVSARTTNGGISIADMESKIDFATTNGGVRLRRVDGDVRGHTTNGGVEVELDGSSWQGEGLDVQTTNGGVNVRIPEHYSAQFEARTSNGGISLDVPGAVRRSSRRDIVMQLGSGGAPIRVQTTNGGVRVMRK
jgi:hypothetical protein